MNGNYMQSQRVLTIWVHQTSLPKPTVVTMPLCGSMIPGLMVCGHRIQVLSMCGGDDKTGLSYIIVATTVVMFTECDILHLLLSNRFCPRHSSRRLLLLNTVGNTMRCGRSQTGAARMGVVKLCEQTSSNEMVWVLRSHDLTSCPLCHYERHCRQSQRVLTVWAHLTSSPEPTVVTMPLC
jgi:hypothetical protein